MRTVTKRTPPYDRAARHANRTSGVFRTPNDRPQSAPVVCKIVLEIRTDFIRDPHRFCF